MKKLSIFKKIKLFNNYKKIIKSAIYELDTIFQLRVDDAYRLYTVINIPRDMIEDAYNLDKNYIDRVAESLTTDYTAKLAGFLNSKGLNELTTVYEMKQLTKYSFLVVYGFSLFKTDVFIRRIYQAVPTILVLLTLLFFYFKFF